MNRYNVLVLVLLMGIAFVSDVKAQQFLSKNGYVEFVSTAPLLEFKGISNVLHGLIDTEENKLDFFIDLNTLDTGIRRRDRDMRSTYLETHRYPFAEFSGVITTGIERVRSGQLPVDVEATGEFSMRGIRRTIRVPGTITSTPDGLLLEASWTIRLEDYNIQRPSVLFYELSEVQTINIRVPLSRVE